MRDKRHCYVRLHCSYWSCRSKAGLFRQKFAKLPVLALLCNESAYSPHQLLEEPSTLAQILAQINGTAELPCTFSLLHRRYSLPYPQNCWSGNFDKLHEADLDDILLVQTSWDCQDNVKRYQVQKESELSYCRSCLNSCMANSADSIPSSIQHYSFCCFIL